MNLASCWDGPWESWPRGYGGGVELLLSRREGESREHYERLAGGESTTRARNWLETDSVPPLLDILVCNGGDVENETRVPPITAADRWR